MKAFLIVLIFVSVAFCQYNFTGYRDTVAVADFQATGTGTTRAFDHSGYGDIVVSVFADDTVEDGYDSDSIQFLWGIEFGDIVYNTSAGRDTTWQQRYVVDTFDIRTAANMETKIYNIDSSGYFQQCKLYIDTLNVTGWATQSRYVSIIAPIFRFWYLGLDENRTGDGYIVLNFGVKRKR